MVAKRRKDSAAKGRWSESVGAGLVRVGRWILRAAPLGLILLVSGLGVRALWMRGQADARFIVAGDTLAIHGPERFCRSARDELRRLGRLAKDRSLLDPHLLTDLRREYEASPWIRRVCRLRRVFPNRISVDLVVRMPAAQVKSYINSRIGYYWQVDAHGLLLPVRGTRKPTEGLVTIEGNTWRAVGRHPAEGRTWQDQGVQDALDLLGMWRSSPLSEDLHIRRITVHRGIFVDSRDCRRRQLPRLELTMAEGVSVLWGTYNRNHVPDEILTSEKIAMLRNLILRDIASVPNVCLDVRTRVPGFSLPPPGEH